jgi:hypothetical protein
MTTSRLVIALLTCCAALMFTAQPGFAQYWMETELGYTLEPVNPDLSALAPSTHPLYAEASAATGVQILALFWVQPGMSRCFERGWDDATQDDSHFTEYELIPARELPAPAAKPCSYVVDGLPLIIGLGLAPGEYPEWPSFTALSLVEQPDGAVTELDRWTVDVPHCFEVYALDLLGDGQVCLVLPWMTGAGGGGGVDVLWLSPAGGFNMFAPNREQASLGSQNGYVNLLDYDGDGVWEIETAFPLMFTAAGYSYKDLLRFDPERWVWMSAEGCFPEYYAPEQAFYRTLISTVHELEKNPAQFLSHDPATDSLYGFELDSEWHSLDPFVNSDTGKFDDTWLADLETMFPALALGTTQAQ